MAVRAQELMSTPRFRCYSSADVVGAELGGALKNVLAIACGISDGIGFGSNARAALITRGAAPFMRAAAWRREQHPPCPPQNACGRFSRLPFCTVVAGLDELTRLAVRCGANPLTLSGLSGVGDLILTCTGDLSRNRTVGLRLGKGESLSEIMASMSAVAEGVLTSKSAYHLAQKMGEDCPIIHGIYRVIHEGAAPLEVVTASMSRPLRPEISHVVAQAAQNN